MISFNYKLGRRILICEVLTCANFNGFLRGGLIDFRETGLCYRSAIKSILIASKLSNGIEFIHSRFILKSKLKDSIPNYSFYFIKRQNQFKVNNLSLKDHKLFLVPNSSYST